MKQGTASSTQPEGKMMQPTRIINPGGVGNIGLAQGSHADGCDFTPRITPLYAGRGYEAPAIRSTSHKSGSQGKF